MNREIKFKCWDGKKMVNTNSINMNYAISSHNHCEVPVLLQYTGLRDVNGKEIYEGDICKWFHDGRYKFIGQIIFAYGSFCFTSFSGQFKNIYDLTGYATISFWWDNPLKLGYSTYEVLGNVFENPELLEKTK